MTFREFFYATEVKLGGSQGGPQASGMAGMNPVGHVNPQKKAASPNPPPPSTMTPGVKGLPNPPAGPMSSAEKNPHPITASPYSPGIKPVYNPPPSPLSNPIPGKYNPSGFADNPTKLQQGKKSPTQKPQGK